MNVNDYLISQAGKDWSALLSFWLPPLPAQCGLWLVNRFGDVFVLGENERVLRLDVGSGVCTEVARNRRHFTELLGVGDNAQEWLRCSLADACRRAGMQLKPQECYGFKIPPTLGGKYEVSNLTPTHLAIHYSYQAYICKQTDVYWIPPA
jgi:hypothetical protein